MTNQPKSISGYIELELPQRAECLSQALALNTGRNALEYINKVFVTTYWPNVLDWCDKNTTDFSLTQQLQPTHIDDRYGCEEI
jgi:hypothetical protein